TAHAATTYLFHLGFTALRNAGVRIGDQVAVIGLGVLGMGTVACASLAGARVAGFSDQGASLALAKQFGAHRSFRKSDRDIVDQSREFMNGDGADVVILTSDRWEDYLLALRVARKRGTISILGFPGRGLPAPDFNPLDSQYVYDKQLRVQASNWTSERDA